MILEGQEFDLAEIADRLDAVAAYLSLYRHAGWRRAWNDFVEIHDGCGPVWRHLGKGKVQPLFDVANQSRLRYQHDHGHIVDFLEHAVTNLSKLLRTP